jgi:hypothetical protein
LYNKQLLASAYQYDGFCEERRRDGKSLAVSNITAGEKKGGSNIYLHTFYTSLCRGFSAQERLNFI